ncbi:MAG TPA: hypothetical protein VHR43_08960 [Gemmatimonadales bacterium]|nr:hypothetical protein [Gemmatimonadales bacterium]
MPALGGPAALAAALSRVDSVESLAGLLAGLGYQPLHDVVPDLLPRPRPEPILTVAQAGTFPWFALAGGPAPERLARRLARRLAARGRLGGVLVLDSARRQLGVAVAFGPGPSLALDLDRPAAEALAQLGRLAAAEVGALAQAARIADALSAEAVGHRFFHQFRRTLDRMSEGLPTALRGEDRRNLALLQLTRVLFLYFIQAKGWLDGRDRFLPEALDHCLARGRRVHRDLLRPLFFGTLNRPVDQRGREPRAFGAVPFLNGGLFEPHPLERTLRGDIPNELWRDAFDGLFERFHFVVAEGRGSGGIAPDMLGRVFEGVMAPDTRRATGTYYTPAALVDGMLRAALAAHLTARLGWPLPEAERRLAAGDPSVACALANVTILDPAAGSGAFLLGALEQLSRLACRGRGNVLSRHRRRILQRNLFGVDRSAAAVRLTELRLWLAVVAHDPADRPEAVEPLPNLDCLIRQGDSLFDPVGGMMLPSPDPAVTRALVTVRRQLVTATGARKRNLVRQLRTAECQAAEISLAAAERQVDAGIEECLALARGVDLFGQPRGLDQALHDRLATARRDRRAVRAARRAIDRERELPWFHYQSHFADVFAGGGFDLVVGNPPWLRAEQLAAGVRRQLTGRYRWWRSSGPGYRHRPDLALAFVERSLELVRPGGVVALLVPAKLATAGYAGLARHDLAASTSLLRVADLTGRPEATFEATVYPLALVVRREAPAAGHRVETTLPGSDGATVPQASLRGGGPWVWSRPRAVRLIERLRREHPAFGERLACHLGVKTGANDLFLDPLDGVEPALLRWAVRGRDVRPFRAEPCRRLLWPYQADGTPLPRLPPGAAGHLAGHLSRLRARADYAGGPPWTLYRTSAATARYRIVWADLARRLTACALTDDGDTQRIPLNTCYVAAAETADEAERMAAWLNCTWLRSLVRHGAVPAAGGCFRFNAAAVRRAPVPNGVRGDAALLAAAQAGRAGEPVQESIDDIAARHLGLSPADRQELAGLVAERTAHRR